MSTGVWEAMASTPDGVRRRLPDPAPLKNACSSAYNLGAATFNTVRASSPDLSAASAIFRRSASWIDRTARVNAPRRISAAVSDPDNQNRIARTTWNLLDHALEYGTRPYTGGIPAYRILKEGLFCSERQTGTGKEMSDMKKRVEKLEALEAARGAEGIMGSGALRYDRRRNPGDAIESFMKSGFRGGDFIGEQVIPVVEESRRRARRDFLLYHHGPPRVNLWEDPLSPSKWKEEHLVLASLSGWGVVIYGGYKFFTGGKKEEVAAPSPQ